MGDTFNMCCAAARIGGRAGYVTRVGDDPFADYLLGTWRGAGVDTSRAPVVDGFNGVYFISNFGEGQREFTYYRAGSAASRITPADLDPAYIGGCHFFFVSGISQAISPSARRTVRAAVEVAKAGGARVAFDTNLRVKLWSLDDARAALEDVLPFVDVILPSAPEESEALIGLSDPEAMVEHFWARGVPMVAVKSGADGCVVGADGAIARIPAFASRRSSTPPAPVTPSTPPSWSGWRVGVIRCGGAHGRRAGRAEMSRAGGDGQPAVARGVRAVLADVEAEAGARP